MVRYNTTELNNIPFSSVAERYSTVKKKGSALVTLCPWHDDHHPSLLVSTKGVNRCKCFSCGKSGSVIDYVMAVMDVGFLEACEVLSRDFSVDPLRLGDTSPLMGREAAQSRRKKVRGDIASVNKIHKEIMERESASRERMRRWDEEQMAKRGYIPMEFVEEHRPIEGDGNTFIECLRSIYTEEGVQFAINEYKLGTYSLNGKDGYVMFPSIDAEGRVHNIKIQRYCTDKQSPQFFHKEERSTFWLGTMLQKSNPELFKDSRESSFDCTCFFGEHLLPLYPDSTVVLVESPKNAVIGLCAVPSLIWLAVGNKNNLTPNRLECLRGRDVIVIPDADAVEEWKTLLSKMANIANFCFSTFCNEALSEQGAKGDVADYLIGKLRLD